MSVGYVRISVLAVALTLAACGGPQYSRDGATDDQRRKDEGLCRAQVDELMVKERGINDDRQATLGATDERLGRTQLPRQMAATDERNRTSTLMGNCMTARGWTVKKDRPF